EDTPSPTPSADDSTDDASTDDADDQWTWEFGELREGLNIEADQVSTDQFVTEGIAFAVLGCEPGQDVTFSVSAGRDDVSAYEETVSADDNGIATHGVRGLDPDSAREYIGEYTVTASCGDSEWTDTFYVGERPQDDDDDAANAGSDQDDNGSAGTDDSSGDSGASAGGNLPRTGTELTGLAAGAGLLALGAAAVYLTRRRSAGTGPADI
ncbi:LPXTG cell wall anchor domain-containing protein, partial [Brevibacterium daeguense]|uniref:LPXTG cell wall anchor domain-containing protein n=1 Tax=Brevibacterium daeguense TaxID=909936 RepID=UPI0031D9B315